MTRSAPALMAALIGAAPALAEPMVAYRKAAVIEMMVTCDQREKIAEVLTKRYAEKRIGHALSAQGRFIEIYSSDVSTSWTITETTAEGVTCLIRSGFNWHLRPGVPS